MINIIDVLRSGSTTFFNGNITNSDIKFTLDNVRKQNDAVDIFKRVLPELIEIVDSKMLFDAIYDINELNNYTYYLIAHNKIRLEEITPKQINSMLINTTWGDMFVLHNLNKILENDFEPKIYSIASAVVENNKIYQKFLYKFIYEMDSDKRIRFINNIIKLKGEVPTSILANIEVSILEDPNEYDSHQLVLPGILNDKQSGILSHDTLMSLLEQFVNKNASMQYIQYLCNKALETYNKNDLGSILLKSKNESIRNYLIDNFDKIFESSISAKKQLLTDLKTSINSKTLQNYNQLINLFDLIDDGGSNCQLMFSRIINYDLYDKIKNLINECLCKSTNNEISYLKHGNTSYVFKIGDYVMKLGNERYCPKIDRHFRIIKNSREIKYINGQALFVIEIQKYLIGDESKITEEMIYELFLDLKNSGSEITDPNALQYYPSNFRLLEDYRDADIDDLSQLPPHFKKNPLVLIDADLVYKKNDINKKHFHPNYSTETYTMDCSMEYYEEKQAYQKNKKVIV